MTSDNALRAALEDDAPAFDPAFRVRVLARIGQRASRRRAIEQAAIWIAAGLIVGLVAQLLTPAESGSPGTETVAMAASIAATLIFLAALTGGTAEGTVRRLREILRW